MNYTKKTNRLINAIWQAIKPYTERIDSGETIDDDFVDQMFTMGETFANQHKDISSASMNPRPDQYDCDAIDESINAVVLHLIHLIGKRAEIEGLTVSTVSENPTEQQTDMLNYL